MISVEEAKSSLLANSVRMESENIPLNETLGRILSADVESPVDHPAFDQTAVDGYAMKYADFESGTMTFTLAGEVPAGGTFEAEIKSGECIRIFTGARIPAGVDTVIMQELVQDIDGKVTVEDPKIKLGKNVRKQAEQIAEGATALIAGTVLNPTAIGFLGSLGISTVEVSKLPRVGITVTGNEFAASKDELKHGKIFESNGGMLKAAFQLLQISPDIQLGPDNPEDLKKRISAHMESNDLIIVTGGVSVGKYDFTRQVLTDLGFVVVFHKVAQKPGKPMLLARKGDQFAFGLPGNPRAVMVAFYEYVLPFVRSIMACPAPFLPSAKIPLKKGHQQQPGRSQFLSGGIDVGGVEILDGQGSHMLQSMSLSDVIVYIPAEAEEIAAGELVEVHFPII